MATRTRKRRTEPVSVATATEVKEMSPVHAFLLDLLVNKTEAIVIFAVGLGWLPTSGTGTVWHWILPIAVLFVRPFGLIVQVVRGSMIAALSSAYVKTARAKGVRSRPIIFVHALRNAMLPVITVIGDQAAALLNGAVVVETIFGFPGVGKLMIDSILQRDFNVVLAAILVTALAIFLMNLLIDLAYALLDPRIRH